MPWTVALTGDLSLLIDSMWSAAAALAERTRRRESQTVEIAAGADAVELAAPAWLAIERGGGAATAFQTHAFASRAAEAHARRGEIPRVVVVREAGRPVVVFPTVVRRWGGIPTIQFLGDPLLQYGDIIAAPDATAAHLDAAWRAAADPAAGRLAYFRKVRADARIAPLLRRFTRTLAEHQAPFVDTGRAAPAARHARELRRLRRRLSELGATTFEIVRGPATRGHIARALEFKRGWLEARALRSSVLGDADWESALLALAELPQARVARLCIDGRVAAVEIALVHNGHWHAYLGALAPEFARTGPGQIQMADTIAHCRDAGIGTYDLLAPADDYKRRMAHGAVTVRDHAAALGPGGRLGLLAARLVPLAKELSQRIPPRLRGSLLGLRPRQKP